MYRKTRNLEVSIIDFLIESLAHDYWDVRVEKSFANVYKESLPCILVEEIDSPAKRREIGSNEYIETHIVNIRIFATNDGLRLDLKDWLFDTIKDGIDYYEHIISSGEVANTTLKGRININRIISNKKELTNTEMLHEYDRFRHLLSLEIRVSLS